MIDSSTQAIVREYELMLTAISFRLSMALNQKKFDPSSINEFQNNVRAIVDQSMAEIDRKVAQAIFDAAREGISIAAPEGVDSIETEVVMRHADILAEGVSEAVRRSAERDSTAAVAMLNKVGLSRVIGGQYFTQSYGEALRGVKYESVDSIGRRWASTTYSRLVVRQAMIHARADAVVIIGNNAGDSEFQIKGGSKDGMKFSVSEKSDLPNYFEVRESVLHPNSNATVVRV